MKCSNRTLMGAMAIATMLPLVAQAQAVPPTDAPAATTTPAPVDDTPPGADSAAPTAAPATAAVAAGATVYGSDGAPVGTIASVAGGNAVVDTGKHKATLALNSFGSGPQGPTITITKSQLEDAVVKATPPAPAPAAEPPAKGKKKGK